MGGSAYEIRIRGRVSDAVLETFGPMERDEQRVETVLYGPLSDQAELHALLDRIAALGLELVEVRRLPSGGSGGKGGSAGGPAGDPG